MSDEGRLALDYVQIQQVLSRYSRGVDRMDRDLILSVYWEDAHDSHGVCEGNSVEFADWVGENMKNLKASNHFLGQSLIDLAGDRADCETYFTAYHHEPRDGGDVMGIAAGRYHDLFERRNGEWRILRREVLFDWIQESPIGDGLDRMFLIRRDECLGRRDRADRSYRSLAADADPPTSATTQYPRAGAGNPG